LSNAIRFSQSSAVKRISIAVDVSRNTPKDDSCLPPLDNAEDLRPVVEREREHIYVYVSVHDTGPGLKPKDLEILVSGSVIPYLFALALTSTP